MFARHAIQPEEAADELEAVQRAIVSGVEVEQFVREVLADYGARVGEGDPVKSAEAGQLWRTAVDCDYTDES